MLWNTLLFYLYSQLIATKLKVFFFKLRHPLGGIIETFEHEKTYFSYISENFHHQDSYSVLWNTLFFYYTGNSDTNSIKVFFLKLLCPWAGLKKTFKLEKTYLSYNTENFQHQVLTQKAGNTMLFYFNSNTSGIKVESS